MRGRFYAGFTRSLWRGAGRCTATLRPSLAAAINDWAPDAVVFILDRGDEISDAVLRGLTVVGAGEDLTDRGWPSAAPDDHEAGRQAARHLLNRGLRSTAAFGFWQDDSGLVTNQWARRREQGFAEVARAANAAYSRFGDPIDPSTGRGAHANPLNVQRWLSSLPKPVGILAPCDNWAPLLTMYCRKLILRVPDDVAIVGVDDERTTCETTDPPLSSVTIPWERIGQTAAELVGEALAGRVAPSAPVLLAQAASPFAAAATCFRSKIWT